MNGDGYVHTDCHEEEFAWSDHVHDTVGVGEHLDHHVLFRFGCGLQNTVNDWVAVCATFSTDLALWMCARMYLGQNKSEDKREDASTHDAVHVEVKVIKLDAIWVWSGNVKRELYEFA